MAGRIARPGMDPIPFKEIGALPGCFLPTAMKDSNRHRRILDTVPRAAS
jgi:hypothetical protein